MHGTNIKRRSLRVSCTIHVCRLSLQDPSWWDVCQVVRQVPHQSLCQLLIFHVWFFPFSVTSGGDRPRNFASRTDSGTPAQFLGCVYRRACTDIFLSQYGHLCWFSLSFRRASLPDEAVDFAFLLATDELGAISAVSEVV